VRVDVYGAISSYDGTRWSSPVTVSTKIEFTSVACPTATFCAAVGSIGSSTVAYATTYDP
jgi:hypothetical protein